MALRSILEYPDPRLRTRAQPVTQFDAALGTLIEDMLQTMYAAPGIGLAATQVDVHQRLVVIDVSDERNAPLVLINPEITEREGEAKTEEGCLSVPGIFDEVKRATRIRLRSHDRDWPAERDGVHGPAGGVHPARDGSPRGQAVRRLPLGDEARAHPQEAREGTQGACRSGPGRDRTRAPHVLALRVAFAGTPGFALPALEALCANHEVVGVLTQPDRPKGRGRHLGESPVKQAARARALALDQPQTLRTAEGRAALRRWAPDVLVVVAYGLLLPREVLTLPPLGCLNIHGSLLPRWRGAAPIQRAILAGDAHSGVTIMQMNEGLDTGPMLLAEPVVISRAHTAGVAARRTLRARGPPARRGALGP